MSILALLSLATTMAASHVGADTLRADSARAERDIRFVALRHAAEVRRCYETQGLRRNPTLAGVLEVTLRVLPTGRVDSASVSASELSGPGTAEVQGCVIDAVRNWRFERGPYDVETIVYPFTLSPSMDAGTGKLRSA